MRRDVVVNVTVDGPRALLLLVLLHGLRLGYLLSRLLSRCCFFSRLLSLSFLLLALLGFLLLDLRLHHWCWLLDRDLLNLYPRLFQLSRLQVCNLMDTVLDLDYEFCFTSLIGVFQFAILNCVLSQLERQTLHELGALLVVDEQVHLTELVLEAQRFGDRERRADVEEGHHLGCVGLVSKRVGDADGQRVVVLDVEGSDVVGRAQDGSLERGTTCAGLKRVEGPREFLLA